MRDHPELPKRTLGDAAHAIAKAGLAAIPGVGGPAVELFQYVVQPPLEKRREQWMAQIAERLKELEANGLKLEDLRDNEQFISAVMLATQAALRTHQVEKLAALRNAVTNIAKGQAPDEALQHLFLSLIDSFTPLHLRILKTFQAPAPPLGMGMGMGGLGNVLEHNLPELRGHRDLYTQIWRDLFTRGLVNTEGLNVTMSGVGLAEKRTTGLGDALLRFISE